MSTVLAVIACLVAVVLWGLICVMRIAYRREMLAATQTMKNQKSTIDVMWTAGSMNREKLEAIESSVAERDETIDGLIAKIEGLEKSYQATCRELDARNCELLAMRNKAKEIFATSFAFNSASDSDQPQKPLCDN